ncbi:hypothetical protein OCU04_005871 [Sclerotinia nivalis]|uniref:Uncharacterized protein n=1 Tax=Sclerotinia nivalis TaxID=352851 RepID=A0A9X0AQ97_9HELO|nr:hypothetical protein OCU04_005871 [Sclerotinia nivalis]
MTTYLIPTNLALLDGPTPSTTAITINGLATREDSSTHPTEEEMECRRLGSLADYSIQRREEEMRLERLHKNLLDAPEEVRGFAAKKIRNKLNSFVLTRENCTLELAAERKELIKSKRFGAYTSYRKKLGVQLYKRAIMDILGPLGKIADQEERDRLFKAENEQLGALRKASGEEWLDAWHVIKDSAENLKEETGERLLNLVDREGEIATGLKKRLDEIDEWETREMKKYKAALMELHKEWEASKKAMRIKRTLLDALSQGDLIKKLSSN